MRYLFIILPVAIALASCSPKYPIKGMDYKTISNIKASKPVGVAWAEVIDYLKANGYSIKEENKAEGTIVTEKYDVSNRYCFLAHGLPMDTTALVALSFIRYRGGSGNNRVKGTADWTIHIKPDGNGSTVNVRLTHLDASIHIPGKKSYHQEFDYYYSGVSTGVFEKKLAGNIK